ncbi:DUF1801 domain-containing protein [Flavobacterium silvaticum]|uniref:DUF1801 domain-containing protein n=1 Tax=Flavobacterium silvaticum TaxID=1852020 RepID=A0A972FJJ9_9FLAO|nr:DUF1801 domain-containing protein [Flavobacterium silvaticum]NMH27136.1 DUF1801 domain-containing protein [Flavobacterium silvaticum]
MAQNKTAETSASVTEFIESKTQGQKREDSFALVELFKKQTGFEPKMWGPSIVGFGSYHYKYDSGHEGDAPLAGFSPRADSFSLYLSWDYENRDELMAKLGKHKAAKACVYIKKLSDVDLDVLSQMISNSFRQIQEKYSN